MQANANAANVLSTDPGPYKGTKGAHIAVDSADYRHAPASPNSAADTAPISSTQHQNVSPQAVTASIPEYKVTEEFAPPKDLDKFIPQPGMPRATRAVSKEHPNGSPNSNDRQTVLQQHVAFWDGDHDGVIWPLDTFKGFRRLGFGYLISTFAVPFIHGSFSYPTQKSWIPDPRMPIYLDRVHRTKHGSDSEVYDTEGRFVPEKFEEIFSKHDKENKGALSWEDIQRMVYHNMNINDPTGWIAERLEWWVTYLLLKDENKLVSKEKIRGVYDGTIWEVVAAQVEEEKRRKTEVRKSTAGAAKKTD